LRGIENCLGRGSIAEVRGDCDGPAAQALDARSRLARIAARDQRHICKGLRKARCHRGA
jgi:hypothetical protein